MKYVSLSMVFIAIVVFLFVLFCINYTIIHIVLVLRSKKQPWEQRMEQEIKRILA